MDARQHKVYTRIMTILKRPRRNRKSQVIRNLVEETQVRVENLIYPMFMLEGQNVEQPIQSMPGISRLSADLLVKEMTSCYEIGVKTFCLFPLVNEKYKDPTGSYSLNKENIYLEAICKIKRELPDACIMTDVALDPYSSDGHDGIVRDGKIVNDETVSRLAEMAVMQAQAGADIIGPSDMMDGRVKVIRVALDQAGYTDTSIMSYTAKYASGFYGPFREALDSAPRSGDKKTYQMNPANVREALLEANLDTEEGADILMVKPALAYLDVIQTLKQNSHLPIAAYNVSGEFSMIKAAAKSGFLEHDRVMQEVLLSIKRAGADIILTYFAKEFALLKNG
jgi:porphobilinogen synthase